MIEIVLDTETTGLSVKEGHRIVEIGCVELKDQISTNKSFHAYINPQRPVSEDAYKIHGYSDEFLSNQKTFSEISNDFLNEENYLVALNNSLKNLPKNQLKKISKDSLIREKIKEI